MEPFAGSHQVVLLSSTDAARGTRLPFAFFLGTLTFGLGTLLLDLLQFKSLHEFVGLQLSLEEAALL